MPLSEHERRQLEQIEQALRADDPRFADAVRAADPRVHYKRRVIAAALGFLIGVGLLLTGVVINVILIAVAGFVVMLACSLSAVTSYRRMTGITTGRDPPELPARTSLPSRAAGRRAAGIRADGAAGGALAASPGWRPLTPGYPLRPALLDTTAGSPEFGAGRPHRIPTLPGSWWPIRRLGGSPAHACADARAAWGTGTAPGPMALAGAPRAGDPRKHPGG